VTAPVVRQPIARQQVAPVPDRTAPFPTAPMPARQNGGDDGNRRKRRYMFATGAVPILLGAVIAVGAIVLGNRSDSKNSKVVVTVVKTIGSQTVTTTSTTSSTATGSTTTHVGPPPFQARMFSVQLPPGNWVLEDKEQARPGYFDTRWHLASDPSVVFLVDYTTPFSGSSLAAANSVRSQLTGTPGYTELGFAPDVRSYGTAWRWEYIAAGVHSIDSFSTACNASYAARGGAPPAVWPQFSRAFDRAIRSVKPACVS
jgi:hypothetical protein